MIQTWNHSRKGLITGEVVADTGDWLEIRLVGDHRSGDDGEVITVRKSFLTEVD